MFPGVVMFLRHDVSHVSTKSRSKSKSIICFLYPALYHFRRVPGLIIA